MSYLRKTDVLDAIKSRVQKVHDAHYTIFEAYLGTNPVTKKPIRLSARSEKELKKKITDFYKKLGTGGDAAVLLSAYQAVDARNALDMLAKAGLSIPLTECVRRIMEDPNTNFKCTTTLQDAYDAYTVSQKGKSLKHQQTVAKRVGTFVAKFGGDRLLSEITANNMSEYLESSFFSDGTEKQKTTYNGHLNYLRSFMRWCVEERNYIRNNPIAAMRKKAKGYVRPEYVSPKEVEKLFRVLEQRGGPDLAYAILSFFCGMRQEEIARVPKGDSAVEIDLGEKYIVVKECKGFTRGIKPRAFTIPNQALAWMQSMPDFVSAARTKNNKFRRHLVGAAKEAGVTLPGNAGRHTFCTMFEAAHHDSNALSAIVGNTEDIRDRHYNGVAKPQDGRDYFAILPKMAGAETRHPETASA